MASGRIVLISGCSSGIGQLYRFAFSQRSGEAFQGIRHDEKSGEKGNPGRRRQRVPRRHIDCSTDDEDRRS